LRVHVVSAGTSRSACEETDERLLLVLVGELTEATSQEADRGAREGSLGRQGGVAVDDVLNDDTGDGASCGGEEEAQPGVEGIGTRATTTMPSHDGLPFQLGS
jgi:hypothetical protein